MLDWETLNQDNYWKQNWPSYHPTLAGLEWTSSHQFKMRPFKLFWGWTENTSSSPVQGLFSPLLCPKNFPSYLPPTSLTSFLAHSRALESSRAWITQSFKETWDTRLEEGGELNVEGKWRGEGKKSTSSQMQKQEKKDKLPPFFAFFFSLWFFFFSSL